MRAINSITLLLLVVGGLNWLLVGLFDFDLVAALFGEMSLLSRIVYVLVGVSAIVQWSRCSRASQATTPASSAPNSSG
ncbi:MAG: DUF378 domain-containing protein [Sphingomicrobium sp.]